MSKAFILNHDYKHSGDPQKDAFHLPFEDSVNIVLKMIDPEAQSLPEKICFQANFDLIHKVDDLL